MDWTILGIAPTKDKKAITAAYRAQLGRCNPEDRPEEFKALRAAYEEALELCNAQETEPSRDGSPLGLWKEELSALYGNFPARIDIESWKELLSRDICHSLDGRPLAEEALLKFLMEDFYLPQSVWQYLDSVFSWQQRREELYESYPRDFIDYAVLNGIRYRESLPYELFTPGLSAPDCDDYRRIFYRANQASGETLEAELSKLMALSEKHPYGELLSYRLMLERGEKEKALEGYRRLAQEHKGDMRLSLEWAVRCIEEEDFAQGEEYARAALENWPEHSQARQILAECLAGQGNFDTAKEEIFKLMDAAGGDQKRIAELGSIVRAWNDRMMQQLEDELRASPRDMSLMSKLAWCYLQNERGQDALELCRRIDDSYEDKYDYRNLYGKVCYSLGMYEEAQRELHEAELILRAMEPDGTEKTQRRIETLPEKLQMQGSCLLAQGKQQEAIELYRSAAELAPYDPEVFTNLGRVLGSLGRTQEAAECFERLTELMPGSYHGHFLLAQSLYELRRDRDAFEAINRALELEGSDLGVYVTKMRILLRNGVWDEVRATLDFLDENGVKDDLSVEWCRAQLTEYADGEKEQALNMYRALAERVEQGEGLMDAARLYYRMLILEAPDLDAREAEDRARMLSLAEKGLSHDKEDLDLLDYKAWLLKRDGRYDEALEIYSELIKQPRRTMDVEREIAEIYYEDLNKNAEKALYYYELILEKEDEAVYHFYAGTCLKYLGRYSEAEAHFIRAKELNPEGIDGSNGLSYLYDTVGRYTDSLRETERVLEVVRGREGNQSRFFRHKVRILRRLCRPAEAAAVIDEMSGLYENPHALREKFEIYCQFGMWDEAEKLVKQMGRRRMRNMQDYLASKIDLLLYKGHYVRAKAAKFDAAGLSTEDSERFDLLFAEMSQCEPAQMRIWEKRRKEEDSRPTHALTNMALCQWWAGNYNKARALAAECLPMLRELIGENKLHEALYRSRLAVVLAVLGQSDEAMEELRLIRSLPLCESCDYCACKDADIFEANIQEILGNNSEALELHRRGLEKWPDELDFAVGMLRCKKRGKLK